MKKSTLRSTLLFIGLVVTVPAALVYLAARLNADRQLRLHEARLSQDAQDAIAHVIQVNKLRQTMPGKPLADITALVFPPLPLGFILRPVSSADRETLPALKDSDFLVQQTGPPHFVIPSAAPPLNIDLNAPAPAN